MRALLAALLALPVPAAAFTGNVGGETMKFLRVGAGARALGMGEAYGPVARGPDALYWNPAGLMQAAGPEVSYSHVEMARFFHHEHLAYVQPARLLGGAVGAGATLFYQDSIDLVTNANQRVGTFSPRSHAFAIGYARALEIGEDYRTSDREYFEDNWYHPHALRPLQRDPDVWVGSLLVGASIKHVSETLYDRTASAWAADGGVLFRPAGLNRATMSFVFRNAGTKPRFVRERESLPAEIAFGASYEWEPGRERRLLAAIEASVPYYGDPFGKFGVEYAFPAGTDSAFAARIGYRSLSAAGLGALTGLTGGVGFEFRRLAIDFAFQSMGELGQAYRISAGYRF